MVKFNHAPPARRPYSIAATTTILSMHATTAPMSTQADPAVSRPAHAADRLLAAISRVRAPTCVGLDPVLDRLPAPLRHGGDPVEAIERFSRDLLTAVAPVVACVKLQSACYERYGSRGVAALERVSRHAEGLGLEVILDAKRGDIGISAEHYAAAAFDPGAPMHADWITINAYLGRDGIEPFLKPGRGAFALVRTSNPGGDAIQAAPLASGDSVAMHVAAHVASIGESSIGSQGYSALGAVVGATKRQDAASLRRLMPRQIFLVPGFGAQGAGVDDVLACFHPDGRGAVITASRSVIYAFKPDDPGWTRAVADAAAAFAEQIGRAVGLR